MSIDQQNSNIKNGPVKSAKKEAKSRAKGNGTAGFFELYCTFFKLGAFSFGGGYAMLQLIEHEIVDVKGWLKQEKIVDIFAVAGALPGAIALNTSAFVGYSLRGIAGAVFAVLGNITPSCIIILTLSAFLQTLGDSPLVASAFAGIRPAVIGLIAFAGYKIGKNAIKDVTGALICAAAFLLSFFFNISMVLLICGGALAGIIVKTVVSVVKSSGQSGIKNEPDGQTEKKGNKKEYS